MDERLLGGLHRHAWRRVPRFLRRRLLAGPALRLAPRISREAVPAVPIIVAGAFRSASGIGEGARLCHDALAEAGLPVFGIDIGAYLLAPDDGIAFAYRSGAELAGPGTLIVHCNGPMFPVVLAFLRRRLVKLKYVVGYWAWELEQLPDSWRPALSFVHEIWAPSRFTAAAISALAPGARVRVLAHPLAQDPPAPTPPPAGDQFRVLVSFNMGSGFARKNPLAAIAAFKRAFPGGEAALTIKAGHGAAYPAGRDELRRAASAAAIDLIEQPLARDATRALTAAAHVVLSPHRSEGFGLVIAESMLAGRPAIATDWSGSTDYLHPGLGIPVGYRLVPTDDPQGFYGGPFQRWADPDIDGLAGALTRLRDRPREAAALGAAAADFARSAWSPPAYVNQVREWLGI